MGERIIEICDCCGEEYIKTENSNLSIIQCRIYIDSLYSEGLKKSFCIKCWNKFKLEFFNFLKNWDM